MSLFHYQMEDNGRYMPMNP